jgi:hypothetical protein
MKAGAKHDRRDVESGPDAHQPDEPEEDEVGVQGTHPAEFQHRDIAEHIRREELDGGGEASQRGEAEPDGAGDEEPPGGAMFFIG